MSNRSAAATIDAYIAEFPPETQQVLQAVRALIRAAAPDAVETISYAIPTFDLHGKHLVHFAGYARHIGLYPGPSGIAAFQAELSRYKSARGSVQFPLDQPLPTDLIRRLVAFRVAESGSGTAAPAGRGDDFPAGLAQPARRALAGAGYTRLADLTAARLSELRNLHGIGPQALRLLAAALAERGWSFAREAD